MCINRQLALSWICCFNKRCALAIIYPTVVVSVGVAVVHVAAA